MTHTPAPWTLNSARSTRVDLIDNAKGHAIGEIVWVDVRNPADARLIAAAPDLLAALEAFTETMEGLPASDETSLRVWDRYHEAKQAIQQAKGAAA